MHATSPGHSPHDHHHPMPHADHAPAGGHNNTEWRQLPSTTRTVDTERHEGHSVAMFRDRFWITLLLSIPTLVWSEMVQHMFGFSAPAFPGSRYVPAFFGTAVYFYGGLVFVKGGLQSS